MARVRLSSLRTRWRARLRALLDVVVASRRTELARLALVATEASDAVVLTDLQRRIVWVNRGFERLTGYTRQEVMGLAPGQLLQCPATDRYTVQRISGALADLQPIRCEILNRGKDGRTYWVELKIQPLHATDGHLEGFMAMQVDITERRRAEIALRAHQALLDRTGRIGGVGGWEVDLASGRVQFTDQTCRILERELGFEPTLEDCLSHCQPEARQRLEAAIAVGLEGHLGWDMELPFVTAHGREIWVRAAAECEYADDGPVRIVGALQDITARRAMKAEIRRSAELMRAAIDAIDEAFVLYDPDDRLVFCNEKYLVLYATTRDLLVPGARFEDIIREAARRGQYPAAAGQEEAWVQRRLAAHRSGSQPLVQQLDSGRVVRTVEHVMPDGHHVGFRVDITDLVRATEAAERADRAKSEFIATISHELRTPLQAIMGFSDLGRHFAQGHPQFEPMFQDIHAGGVRMLKLVNGLLDVSKIDGTQGTLQLKPGDLAVLAAEVARELAPLAEARRVTLALPDPLPHLPVDVDAFRIQQVVRNVLANAIRFSPEGAMIELAGQVLPGGAVELTVRDHGPGIPPEETERVFEAFVQSSRTRNGSGGTGLGLTISRKIASAHGGRLDALAPPAGQGALLRLWLPTPRPVPGEQRATRPLRSLRAAATPDTPSPEPEVHST
jgi:PAS domain S-box-containing protein